MLKRSRQIDWEDGSAEVISFVIIFPLILFSFLMILYGMQLSLTAQSLQYTTYSATRAAAISENEYTGLQNADSIITHCLPQGYMNVTQADFDWSYVEGREWLKGSIIKGTVTVQTKLLIPFGNIGNAQSMNGIATLRSSICMMLERPAI